MEFYIEIWNVKEAWKKLSKEERGNYMAQIGPHVESLLKNGVEMISWGANYKDAFKRAGFDYFAIWKFPNKKMVKEFEELVNSAGWYDYFDQVNLSGENVGVDAILGEMINM